MNWGDMGDKFYIIIKGSVKVLVPSNKLKDSKDQMDRRYQELQNLVNDISDLDQLIEVKEHIHSQLASKSVEMTIFTKMRNHLKKAYQQATSPNATKQNSQMQSIGSSIEKADGTLEMKSIEQDPEADEVFENERMIDKSEKAEMISNINNKHKKLIVMQE